MYLVNYLKCHGTPFLNFTSLIKVKCLPLEKENTQYQLPIKLSVIHQFLDKKFSSHQAVSRKMQKQKSNNLVSPIRLEMSIEKISELLQHKQICAADIRCLDSNSKQCITKLCLLNCLDSSEY